MKLTLCAIAAPLLNAWNDKFHDISDHVTVTTANILQIPADAIVSPANSFGFMDGGFDWTLTQRFGEKVQRRLQSQLNDKQYTWHGEIPVGMAASVATDDPIIPNCICAPTMRVPMILGPNSINAYLAARAAFICALDEGYDHITMTGLGTGVGQVPVDICAHQMRQAWDDIFAPQPFPATWQEAQKRHQLLTTNVVRDLQYHA